MDANGYYSWLEIDQFCWAFYCFCQQNNHSLTDSVDVYCTLLFYNTKTLQILVLSIPIDCGIVCVALCQTVSNTITIEGWHGS